MLISTVMKNQEYIHRLNHLSLPPDVLNAMLAEPFPGCDELTEQAWQRHVQRLAQLEKEGPGNKITGANKHTGTTK